ncbi:hypothetical protein KUV85_14205 [Nocardioides panacisoli]|uniref:hypothetical protein n=1 Tax=Nocardioides panacisoli TaxID=627624 RepID=UPI001C630C34|nr:hypothetical protein [Nocardioides panacisoli]QYJ03470.1 hypothetical protein KUV85_14205 [Nocardioides panacisoli]
MTSLKRSLALAGAAPILALSLTACGGGGAPTDAAVEDFCNIGDELGTVFEDVADDDYEGFVDAAAQASETMEEIGTPEDIPDDARAGFESLSDALSDLDSQDVEDSVKELTDATESGEDVDEQQIVSEMFGIDDDDISDFEAFTEYTEESCSS